MNIHGSQTKERTAAGTQGKNGLHALSGYGLRRGAEGRLEAIENWVTSDLLFAPCGDIGRCSRRDSQASQSGDDRNRLRELGASLRMQGRSENIGGNAEGFIDRDGFRGSIWCGI